MNSKEGYLLLDSRQFFSSKAATAADRRNEGALVS